MACSAPPGPLDHCPRGHKTPPSPTQDDPLLDIVMPPPHETVQQRAARETSEMQAKALSEEIDRQIYRDRSTLTSKDAIRILLLGQSESGKSTTLKNFQLFCSPQAFNAERKAWRYVVFLNLARSVRIILELMEDQFALQDKYEASRSSPTYTSLVSVTRSNSLSLSEDTTTATSKASPPSGQLLSSITGHRTLPHSHKSSFAGSGPSRDHGSDSKYRALFVRSTYKDADTVGEAGKDKKGAGKNNFTMDIMDGLISGDTRKKRARSHSDAPPNSISTGRDKQISSTSSTDSTLQLGRCIDRPRGSLTANSLIISSAPRRQIHPRQSNTLELPTGPLLTSHHRLLKMKLAPLAAIESQLLYEFSIPAGDEAQTCYLCPVGRLRDYKELIVRPPRDWEEKFGRLRIGTPKWLKEEPKARDPDDPSYIINACADDMIRLWKDSAVRELLAQNKTHLEYEPGFFLNDIDRVAKLDYQPTDDDILRTRFHTNGVCEYKFQFGNAKRHWVIYDVGGTRTQRAVWQSYFDDVNAIIFLVPLSAFDQNLVEDPKMNRMEDSVQLFQRVCSSRLLTRVNIVLFLNKLDLLEAKLKAGVWVNKFIKQYGDRGNTPEAVTRYFRHFFAAIHKEATPIGAERTFYSHVTSVTNPRSMRSILEILHDVIVRNNVEDLVL